MDTTARKSVIVVIASLLAACGGNGSDSAGPAIRMERLEQVVPDQPEDGHTAAIRLAVAEWMPPLHSNYGLWGVVVAGQLPEEMAAEQDTSVTLQVAPGSYDLYWQQDYDHRQPPPLLVREIPAEKGRVTTVAVRTGIRLDTAEWVPAMDSGYGWWGAVRAGEAPEEANLLNWMRSPGAAPYAPGLYDVYWARDYDHRSIPVLVTDGLALEEGDLASVRLETGIVLEVAEWVPPLDSGYGWWGAVGAGEEPKWANLVNWSRTPQSLPHPAGEYDVYWAQDYDHQSAPVLVAAGVTVATGELVSVSLSNGVRLTVSRSTASPHASYGWWGVVPTGADPKAQVNWSRDPKALLPTPPGRYDVWWKQDYDSAPVQIASGVVVPTGELVEVVADPAAAPADG